jgi:hypothetical protein
VFRSSSTYPVSGGYSSGVGWLLCDSWDCRSWGTEEVGYSILVVSVVSLDCFSFSHSLVIALSYVVILLFSATISLSRSSCSVRKVKLISLCFSSIGLIILIIIHCKFIFVGSIVGRGWC